MRVILVFVNKKYLCYNAFMSPKKQKVVFLDRDGTLIFEPPGERLIHEEDEKLFPDDIEALKLLSEHNIPIVIITNQAAIAEGTISVTDFHHLNDGIIEKLKPSGVSILKTYFCPHGPNDNCECRKPKPKMLFDAADEFDIDLKNSYMIGDRLSDIEAGINAGTKTILVKTGLYPVTSDMATLMAEDLLEAIEYIVAH